MPIERRQNLLNEMNNLSRQGITCAGCEGTCCTFVANSMQITALEALDIYNYLNDHNRITTELVVKLQDTISRYRLDQEIPSNGKRNFMRRTYTCPFFSKTLGCTLSRKVKPYGCLGFNPTHKTEKKGNFCKSNKDLLKNCEYNDENGKIKKSLSISWNKKPIPIALLEIIS